MKIVNEKVMRLVLLARLFATGLSRLTTFGLTYMCITAYDILLVLMICEVT